MQVTSKVLFEKRATDVGSYSRSPASRISLRHYLRGCATTFFKSASDNKRFWETDEGLRKFLIHLTPGTFKQADIGGDQEQGFEQAFSSLGYAYIKDKSPRLIDFIVGFQLVDRNEDSTKAMGVFGFKVADQWLYAPIFFLNGDLKGHELLYIKKQDAFVPMKENWINYLISRQPHVLGKGSPQNTYELGGLMPNLTRLAKQPSGTKYGSDQTLPINIDSWAYEVMPLIASLATKKANALYPEAKQASNNTLNFKAIVDAPFKAAFAPFSERFDLNNFLKDFPLLKSAFENCYMAYPAIKKGFDKFYGIDFFKKIATSIKDDMDSLVSRAKQARFIGRNELKRNNKKKRKKKASDSIIPEYEPEPFDKDAELTIIALDVSEDVEGQIDKNKEELDDKEREKLLSDTILIKDKRDSHGVSIAYNTQVRLELSNPDATGLYDILEKPGTFDEMLVISNPHTGRGREDFCLVIRKNDPRAWKNTVRPNLWAKQNRQPTDTDFKTWIDKLDGVETLNKGGTYVALHEDGSGTCPFRIKESYGDGAYKVEWLDDISYSDRPYKLSPMSGGSDWDVGYSPWNAKLRINNRKGSHLRSSNGELSIPDSFKILKVKNPPKPKKKKDDTLIGCCQSEMSSDRGESESSPIQPGNLVDVQLLIQKQARVIKIHDTGANEIWIKSPLGHERMTKKAGLISLVRDHGLREDQAREMLKEASACSIRGKQASYFIKYAYGYESTNLQPGPGAPAIPEPMRGIEQNGPNSVPSIYPQEEFQPVPGMDSNQTDPSIYDPFYTPDQSAMSVAQEASNSGQKEVFDTASISGMLKAVRQDSLVDRYLGDLMKAVDKLGRIIFMFYWHNDEFEDRYSKESLPELEDSLRNSFETLGDLVLYLKERSVQGQHGTDFNSGGTGPSTPEPSVEEAAKN